MDDLKQNNKSNFEYRQADWDQAEKLIVKEEKRKRAAAIFLYSGIAAVVLASMFVVNPFGNEKSEPILEQVGRSVIVEEPISIENEMAKKKVLSGTDLKDDKELYTGVTEGESKFKGASFAPTYHEEILTNAVATAEPDDLKEMLDEVADKKPEAILSKMIKEFSLVKIDPLLTKMQLSLSSIILEKTFEIRKKSHSLSKEVYVSMMTHPGYLEENDKMKAQFSYNAGFLIGSKIWNNLSFSAGLQYNNYRSINQSKEEEEYNVTEPDQLINSYSVVENEEWVVVDAVYTPVDVNNVTTANQGTGFTIVAVTTAGNTINNSSNNSLPDDESTVNVVTSSDTTFFQVLEEGNTVRGTRHKYEKAVLVGSILLPLELHYRLKTFRFTGGVSVEYLIHNKVAVQEWNEIDSWTTKDEPVLRENDFASLNRTMFNMTLGVDYFIMNRLSLGFKGSFGLKDLTNNAYFSNLTFERNSNLSLSLRYHWK